MTKNEFEYAITYLCNAFMDDLKDDPKMGREYAPHISEANKRHFADMEQLEEWLDKTNPKGVKEFFSGVLMNYFDDTLVNPLRDISEIDEEEIRTYLDKVESFQRGYTQFLRRKAYKMVVVEDNEETLLQESIYLSEQIRKLARGGNPDIERIEKLQERLALIDNELRNIRTLGDTPEDAEQQIESKVGVHKAMEEAEKAFPDIEVKAEALSQMSKEDLQKLLLKIHGTGQNIIVSA